MITIKTINNIPYIHYDSAYYSLNRFPNILLKDLKEHLMYIIQRDPDSSSNFTDNDLEDAQFYGYTDVREYVRSEQYYWLNHA